MGGARGDRIVWMELEMTGLDVERERILEVAVLVTDAELELVAEGPCLAVRQPEALLAAMDAWNAEHHAASGLLARVRESEHDDASAEALVLEFLREHVPERACPLAGNSVWQDRRFLARYWPKVDAWLHYRILDVSTLKELAKRWAPHALASAPPKRDLHRALDDVRESVEELRHYRRTFLR